MKAHNALQCAACGRINLHKDAAFCSDCGFQFGGPEPVEGAISKPRRRLVPGGRRLELIQGGATGRTETATDEVATHEAATDEAATDEAATHEAARHEAATDEAAKPSTLLCWRPMTTPPSVKGSLTRVTAAGRAPARPPRDLQLEETVHMDAKKQRAQVSEDNRQTIIAGPSNRVDRVRTDAAGVRAGAVDDAPSVVVEIQRSETTRGARVKPRRSISRAVKRPAGSMLDAMDGLYGPTDTLDEWGGADLNLEDSWDEPEAALDDVIAASGLGRRNLYWLVGLLVVVAGGVTAALVLT
jgi:hypothetical protein